MDGQADWNKLVKDTNDRVKSLGHLDAIIEASTLMVKAWIDRELDDYKKFKEQHTRGHELETLEPELKQILQIRLDTHLTEFIKIYLQTTLSLTPKDIVSDNALPSPQFCRSKKAEDMFSVDLGHVAGQIVNDQITIFLKDIDDKDIRNVLKGAKYGDLSKKGHRLNITDLIEWDNAALDLDFIQGKLQEARFKNNAVFIDEISKAMKKQRGNKWWKETRDINHRLKRILQYLVPFLRAHYGWNLTEIHDELTKRDISTILPTAQQRGGNGIWEDTSMFCTYLRQNNITSGES